MISRRGVLAGGLIGTVALCSRPLFGAEQSVSRRITLKNLHTGEGLDVEYFRDDAYLPDAMAAIQALLRDFRNGEQHAIDPKLLDYLVEVAARIGRPEPMYR